PWNSDMVWFSAAEAPALVPTQLRVGAVQQVPAALVRRLARLHLFDNVMGQGIPFQDRSVEVATLTATVTAAQGNRVELRLAGQTRTNEPQRGVETRLLGRATFDRGAGHFTAFELL